MFFRRFSIVSILLFILFFCFVFFYYNEGQKNVICEARNLAIGCNITASSSNDLSRVLVDGKELPNSSWYTSWSPPQFPARPSWINVDLGDIHKIERLVLVFAVAAYEGIYDIWSPPKSVIVEIGKSLKDMRQVKKIYNIPTHGSCVDKRRLELNFKRIYKARYIKLVFPDGGKNPSAPDIIGLGEVKVYGPKLLKKAKKNISIEGSFGKVLVDLNSPQITKFFLREPNNSIVKKNILSGPIRGVTLEESRDKKIFFRRGAYTYITDKKGNRFESYRSCLHTTNIKTNLIGKVEKIVFRGIRLRDKNDLLGPVEEDWILEKTKDGDLSWTITQRWLNDFKIDISGTPSIYLARFGGWGAYRDNRVYLTDPQITSTIWYQPEYLNSNTHPDYETHKIPPGFATEYRTHNINVLNTWAIYKLFTNFHLKSDLCLSVNGGHLFRRAGVRNDFNEIGAVINPYNSFECKKGEVFSVTLIISSKDKFKTGQQLDVNIPDDRLSWSLKDLHASILNGGIITDPKRFNFGNGTEDINYAGSADFQARALSVSTSVGMLAKHQYSADHAFKGHLERILSTINNKGLTCFGFNSDGKLIDDNLHVIIAAKIYAIKTGDIQFIKDNYDAFVKMIHFFIKNIDKSKGLFLSPEYGAHWYYDGINFSGFNAYYQAFFYKALLDISEMSEIIGKIEEADNYKICAKRLSESINKFMWIPDAPGGARYADWIDKSGNRATYFVDIVQYPLIAFGIASEERAKSILSTANKRLLELTKKYKHNRKATLSLLWPISNTRSKKFFGSYFYGGSLLSSTYWEIIARARVGHVDGKWGAYRLLKNFAKHFDKTSFVGSNSIDIRGNVSLGGDEGYLSDMVVVPSALIHGLLGVNMTWNKIIVTPSLPRMWKYAKTKVMWKGKLYNISIEENDVNIYQDKD